MSRGTFLSRSTTRKRNRVGRVKRPVAVLSAALLVASLLVGVAPGVAAATAPSGVPVAAVSAGVEHPDFRSMTPARIADTRPGYQTVDGQFRGTGFVSPAAPLNLVVAGRAGVPASGVVAVALNVTVTQPQAQGHLTAHPAGRPAPNASNINFVRGDTVANSVIVEVGTGGAVTLRTAVATHVIVDVTGFFIANGIVAVDPARLVDTRPGYDTVDHLASGGGPVTPSTPLDVTVTGRGGVPTSGVTAVVLNVVAISPPAGGYLTAYPNGVARPVASNVNFVPGRSAANSVIVKVGTGGRVRIHTSAGPTHVAVDLAGYFTTASTFVPLTPARYADSRRDTGVVAGPSYNLGWNAAGDGLFGPRTGILDSWEWWMVGHSGYGRLDVPVTDRNGLPATDIGAVVLNVTSTGSYDSGHLSVYPTGGVAPNASSLNFARGVDRPNMVIAKIGGVGAVSVLSPTASTHVVVDVAGYFPTVSTADDPNVWTATTRDYTGMPVTYDRCEPVRYQINTAGAKPGWVADVVAAFDIVAAATGLTFQRLADTSEAPGSLSSRPAIAPDGKKNPVLVAFPTREMAPELDGALAIGGSKSMWSSDGPTIDPQVFYTGITYFDRDRDTPAGFGMGGFGPIALHEIGHLLGLGHVDNVSEIMYPIAREEIVGFGPGDLKGLATLYRTQDCPGSPATYPPLVN